MINSTLQTYLHWLEIFATPLSKVMSIFQLSILSPFLISGLRDYQDAKADVILKYSGSHNLVLSAPIGAWKCNFPPFSWNYDQPTNGRAWGVISYFSNKVNMYIVESWCWRDMWRRECVRDRVCEKKMLIEKLRICDKRESRACTILHYWKIVRNVHGNMRPASWDQAEIIRHRPLPSPD